MVLDGPGNARQLNRAITDRRYSTADERSRARKGAENRIQADRLGQCERLRRAVDCAPYLNSTPQRLGR